MTMLLSGLALIFVTVSQAEVRRFDVVSVESVTIRMTELVLSSYALVLQPMLSPIYKALKIMKKQLI